MFMKTMGLSLLCLACGACNSAPSNEQVKAAMKKVMPVETEVEQVQGVKGVPGLYEVVVRTGNQPVVVYMDKKARYVFSGSLVSVDSKANLTAETLNRFLKK